MNSDRCPQARDPEIQALGNEQDFDPSHTLEMGVRATCVAMGEPLTTQYSFANKTPPSASTAKPEGAAPQLPDGRIANPKADIRALVPADDGRRSYWDF